MSRATFDTNILVYAEALETVESDLPKIAISRDLTRSVMVEGGWTISAQVLAELFRVLVHKKALARAEAMARVGRWQSMADVQPTAVTTLVDAIALATRHKLQIFDAIILAAAAEARCDTLYSEDFQHGFTWRGVEVIDPFR